MVVALRRWTAGQGDEVGFAPVVQLPMPVDLAPVPQGPVQPFLGKALLNRYTVPSATSSASATLGAAQLSSLLRRIRALAVTRAELFPTRIRFWSSSRCSGASRTAYLSLIITAPPSELHPKQYTTIGQIPV